MNINVGEALEPLRTSGFRCVILPITSACHNSVNRQPSRQHSVNYQAGRYSVYSHSGRHHHDSSHSVISSVSLTLYFIEYYSGSSYSVIPSVSLTLYHSGSYNSVIRSFQEAHSYLSHPSSIDQIRHNLDTKHRGAVLLAGPGHRCRLHILHSRIWLHQSDRAEEKYSKSDWSKLP